MALIILWQVFARYVLNTSPSWSEQLSLFLMVWTILLAAAAGVRENFHIRITALQDISSPRVQKILLISTHLITLLIGAMLFFSGMDIVGRTWNIDIPALPVSRGVALLPIPISGALMMLFSLEHVLAILNSKEVEQAWNW